MHFLHTLFLCYFLLYLLFIRRSLCVIMRYHFVMYVFFLFVRSILLLDEVEKKNIVFRIPLRSRSLSLSFGRFLLSRNCDHLLLTEKSIYCENAIEWLLDYFP